MNGVHDMGGMHGFGPIVHLTDEPAFYAEWESRVRGMSNVCFGRYFNGDAFRYGIERMEPAHYLSTPYYERWLASLATNLIEGGFLTAAEWDARTELLGQQPDVTLPHPDPASVQLPPPANVSVPRLIPRFAIGDEVMTRNVQPRGHTRLPRYTRGKRGVIQLIHGTEVFPDTNAHYLGEDPQVVYNVRFDGRDLWGESAEPGTVVSIDLWESYLEPVAG